MKIQLVSQLQFRDIIHGGEDIGQLPAVLPSKSKTYDSLVMYLEENGVRIDIVSLKTKKKTSILVPYGNTKGAVLGELIEGVDLGKKPVSKALVPALALPPVDLKEKIVPDFDTETKSA